MKNTMRAMVLERVGQPLKLTELPVPEPNEGELLLKVLACGICRTDLHVVDGELTEPRLPLVPGHQIVGVVAQVGTGVAGFKKGDSVGVPWLGGTCGECGYCREGRENLCDAAVFTGYQRDGGFSEYCTADARFCFPLPGGYPAVQAAPLLCAGGGLDRPPQELDAAIIFAPAGELVPAALRAVAKGGVVVCGGIHMSAIPSFPYDLLWGERSIVSVANLTRQDGEEFLFLAPRVPVRTEVEVFRLAQANEALDALRSGRIRGAGVLVP